MAEFTEIMRIKNRMCIGRLCGGCPLDMECNSYNIVCDDLINEHPEEFERICIDWAKENPEITNRDKLYQIVKEAFGEDIAKGLKPEGGCTYIKCNVQCDGCNYDKFWNKPYVEPKESE